jgi:excisionase family DNA binding protein
VIQQVNGVPEPGVTINEARTLARVSRRTIYNWIDQGKVEYYRTAGGSIRIVPASLFRPAGSR